MLDQQQDEIQEQEVGRRNIRMLLELPFLLLGHLLRFCWLFGSRVLAAAMPELLFFTHRSRACSYEAIAAQPLGRLVQGTAPRTIFVRRFLDGPVLLLLLLVAHRWASSTSRKQAAIFRLGSQVAIRLLPRLMSCRDMLKALCSYGF